MYFLQGFAGRKFIRQPAYGKGALFDRMRFVNVFFLDTEAGGGCWFFFNGPLRIAAGTGGYLLLGNQMLGIDEEVGPGQEQ